MTIGIVLIKVEVGKERSICDKLRKVEGVTAVYYLQGKYDILVLAKSKDTSNLALLVIDKIRAVDGVKNTQTHIKVDL